VRDEMNFVTAPNARRESWLDRVIDRIKPQPSLPDPPAPPPVDQTQWERSADAHKLDTLTVHDVGLIVFNETQSFTDRDNANETIGAAREKVAHVIMNGDEKLGRNRPISARPIEPSAKALKDPRTRASYDSSLKTAREAYLSPTDPTHGATHFKFVSNGSRSEQRFGQTALPIRTQSGPFNNSYTGRDVHSKRVYVNTYAPG
jgi:hypothetical protein